MVVRKGHRYGGQEGSQIWWAGRVTDMVVKKGRNICFAVT